MHPSFDSSNLYPFSIIDHISEYHSSPWFLWDFLVNPEKGWFGDASEFAVSVRSEYGLLWISPSNVVVGPWLLIFELSLGHMWQSGELCLQLYSWLHSRCSRTFVDLLIYFINVCTNYIIDMVCGSGAGTVKIYVDSDLMKHRTREWLRSGGCNEPNVGVHPTPQIHMIHESSQFSMWW